MSSKQNQCSNTRRYTVGMHVASTEALAVPRDPGKCARLDGDLSNPDMLRTLVSSPQYEEMYLTFSAKIRRLYLLLVGTATVERPVSDRCRLTAHQFRDLLLLSDEGPHIPNVRDAMQGAAECRSKMTFLLPAQYLCWQKKPRR
jgi:hypothetical protein